jgi:molybdopterin synthase catalytic subunit
MDAVAPDAVARAEPVGAAGARLSAISSDPLSVDSLTDGVVGPNLGGLVVFVGKVRDHDGGRGVTRLDYSAHPNAADELARVVAEVGASAPAAGLGAVHRIGELAIGDLAVVVAAACPHRDEAFDLARTLIDRVKAEVPIWKRQWFVDGTHEWVGACD